MSIRYNRQYNVAAPGNDEVIGFLNGDDVYLGGGGPSGGGGGSTGGGNSGGGTGGGTGDGNTGGGEDIPDDNNPVDPLPTEVNYEIAIGSNLENEVGDLIKLKYEIRSSESVLDSDEILLADGSTDNKSILESLLKDNVLNIYLENTLPSNYSIVKIYYTDKQTAINYPSDYTKWKVGNTFIGQQATELKRGVAVAVILEKEISVAKPVIVLESSTYTKQIKDSDTDSIINIKFTKTDCDFVDFYIATDKKIRVNASNGFVSLSFKNDFS